MTTGHGIGCRCSLCDRPDRRRQLAERVAHAEAEAARHLGNYNEHRAAGRTKAAEWSLDAFQRWLDRANDLRGNGST